MLAQKEQDQGNSRTHEQAGIPAGQVPVRGETCVSRGYVRTLEIHLERAWQRYQQDLARDKAAGEDPEANKAYWIGYCAGECYAIQHAIDLLHISIIHDERSGDNHELVSKPDGGIDSHVEHID